MKIQEKKQTVNNSNNIITKIRKSPSFNIFGILIIMCIIMTFASDKFLTFDNLFSVSRAFSYIAILALGQALVIITGGIDLSIGSVFGFAGVIAALGMARWSTGILGSVFIGILSGVIFGLFNGFFVTKVKLPPFIATLGTLSIARGLCYVFTRGYPIANLPKGFLVLGQGYVGPVPVPVLIMIGIAILVHIFLNRTVAGRRIFAVGGNMEAARLSGINVEKLLMFVYSLCGALAAFAGIITASRLGLGQPTAGIGYELDAVAATVIGGASLSGGFASVPGTIFGAAIMGVLRNALVLLNVSAYWQEVVIGTVIIVAVSADQLRKMRTV